MASDNDEGEEEEEEAIIEKAELITIPTPHSPRPGSLPLGGTLMQVEPLPMISPVSPMPRMSAISPRVLELTSDKKLPVLPSAEDAAETASARSLKSTKSVRSAKSSWSARTIDGTRLSQVSAAKTRSHRTSKASLRLPRPSHLPHEEHPPVPDIPLEFASMPFPPTSPTASSKFLHDSRAATPPLPPTSSARRRKTSLDDIMPPRRSTTSYAASSTMDDIYVRPYRLPHRHYFEIETYRAPHHQGFEIEIVPRTPPPHPRAPQAKYDPSEPPSERIPSMWLHADAAPPKNPLEHFEEAGPMKQTSYSKLKTMTKRYSMSLPLFRRSSSSSGKSRPPSHQSS